MSAEYQGWKNYESWNVALWLENEERNYRGAVDFMKDYKGNRPYIDFCIECGLDAQKTPDGVAWIDPTIDLLALNAVMMELAPEKEDK